MTGQVNTNGGGNASSVYMKQYSWLYQKPQYLQLGKAAFLQGGPYNIAQLMSA